MIRFSALAILLVAELAHANSFDWAGKVEDDKPDVKRETIDQLEQLGDRRAVIPLVARFGDSQLEIRKSAVRAVGRLGDPSAIPALIRLLNDSQEDIRSAAAGSLGSLNAV